MKAAGTMFSGLAQYGAARHLGVLQFFAEYWQVTLESRISMETPSLLIWVGLLRNRLVKTARESMRMNSSLGQLYGNMQEAYQQMQTPLIHQPPSDPADWEDREYIDDPNQVKPEGYDSIPREIPDPKAKQIEKEALEEAEKAKKAREEEEAQRAREEGERRKRDRGYDRRHRDKERYRDRYKKEKMNMPAPYADATVNRYAASQLLQMSAQRMQQNAQINYFRPTDRHQLWDTNPPIELNPMSPPFSQGKCPLK